MSLSKLRTDPPLYGGTIEPIVATAPNGRPTPRPSVAPQKNISSIVSDVGSAVASATGLSWLSPLIGIGSDLINYAINKRDYNEQFDKNNAEWQRRFDETNKYNEDWAYRLRTQGLNPISAIGQGVNSNTASMAGGPQMMSGPLSSMSNILSSMATGADIELKGFDTKLKDQLYNFNLQNNPLLIKEAAQRLANTQQEYNNLVAEENYDKVAAQELKSRMQEQKANIALLMTQEVYERAKVILGTKQVEKLEQDIETGKFIQEYEKWHAEHEQVLTKLADTQYKISQSEFETLYESGLFGDMKKDEARLLSEQVSLVYEQYRKQKFDNEVFDSLWSTDPDTGIGNMILFFMKGRRTIN